MKHPTVFFDSGGTLYSGHAHTADIPTPKESAAAGPLRVSAALTGYGYDIAAGRIAEAIAEIEPHCRETYQAGYNYHRLMTAMLAHLSVPLGREVAACLADAYAGPRYADWLFPNTVETLTTLYENGVYLGVIANTAWPGFTMDRHFAGVGLLDVLSIRIYSGDIGIEKPNPAIFRLAETISGRSDNILYVGDSIECDVHGARNVGWRVAYRQHDGQDACPEADYTFTDSEQLLSIIL